MKKYTNLVLITAIVIFVIAITIRFFIFAQDVKVEIRESEKNELQININ